MRSRQSARSADDPVGQELGGASVGEVVDDALDQAADRVRRRPGRSLDRRTVARQGRSRRGGLETTRSKRSPATGWNRDPARRSQCWPLSRAVAAASASARGFVSVAVTDPECEKQCSAWIPQPVPRSSVRPTGARITAFASEIDAAPMPSTWSGRTGPGRTSESRSDTTMNDDSSSACGLMSRPARYSSPERSKIPAATARSRPVAGSAAGDVAGVLGGPEQEQSDQDVQRRTVPGRVQRGPAVPTGQRIVGAHAQPLRHRVGVESRDPQVVAEAVDYVGIRQGQGTIGGGHHAQPRNTVRRSERQDARRPDRPPGPHDDIVEARTPGVSG